MRIEMKVKRAEWKQAARGCPLPLGSFELNS
jgi:hypothetical protein